MFQEAVTEGIITKKVVLNISLNIKCTGRHLCLSLFFNKFACLRPAALLEKRYRNEFDKNESILLNF